MLRTVSAIYDNLDNGTVVLHRVTATNFQQFSRAVSSLSRVVGADDLRTQIMLSWLKRLRFVLSSAPVAFNHPLDHCLDSPDLARWRAELGFSYGSERALINDTFDLVDDLCVDVAAPLHAKLEDVLLDCKQGQSVALVSPDTSLLACFDKEAVATSKELGLVPSVMGPRGLKEDYQYDRVVLFGAASWFKPHVFAAPRASRIDLIQYGWIPTGLPSIPRPTESSIEIVAPSRRVHAVGELPKATLEAADVQEVWTEPEVAQVHTSQPNALTEDARLVSLEAGHGVYVASSEDSHVIIIDDSSGIPDVRQIAAADLDPGMHLVLRTGGGADYVREVADHLLGRRAHTLRSAQSEWKVALNQRIEKIGEDAVAAALVKLGLAYASRGSVQRWGSERNIGTKSSEMFEILVGYVGLGQRANELWKNAKEIWAAHSRAGFRIRSMLLVVLRESDLTPLRRYGRMDFELATPGAGTLTAFTVREVSSKVRPTLSNRIGKPFPMAAAYSWLD